MDNAWKIDFKRGFIPNAITLFSLFLVPFIILFHYHNYFVISLALFVSAWIMDAFDGWWARKNNCCTRFGAFMDPFADKIFTWSLLIYFWGIINPTASIMIITVGICLTAARVWKIYYGVKKQLPLNIMATKFGKIKVNLEKSGFTLIILSQIIANHNIIPNATGLMLNIANFALFTSLIFAAFSLKRQIQEIS